nr:immunoglobulin heavy chain junction region [Mus musculus]
CARTRDDYYCTMDFW